MRHIVHCLLVLTVTAMFIACGKTGGIADQTSHVEQIAAPGEDQNAAPAPAASRMADSPTAAYKRLFAAVKAKDTNAIRALMSKKTQGLATMMSQRNKQPIEKSYENGFTATTFAETLPEIRDERVNGNFGAVEVWNNKDSTWEDLPFILEDGSWKLAVGELFDDTFQSPGMGLAKKERHAANSQVKSPINGKALSNVGKNSNY